MRSVSLDCLSPGLGVLSDSGLVLPVETLVLVSCTIGSESIIVSCAKTSLLLRVSWAATSCESYMCTFGCLPADTIRLQCKQLYICPGIELTASVTRDVPASCTSARFKSNVSESENAVPSEVGVTDSSSTVPADAAALSDTWRRLSLDGIVSAYCRYINWLWSEG